MDVNFEGLEMHFLNKEQKSRDFYIKELLGYTITTCWMGSDVWPDLKKYLGRWKVKKIHCHPLKVEELIAYLKN
jgi:predicted PilT family ATPase